MKPIPIGAKGSFTLLVQPQHLANQFKDAMLPPVLATPVMIMIMENAALNAIRGFLDPGESAVGTAVNVRHLAATPAGRQVTGEAEVTGVNGRRIDFDVRATEGGKEIGVGSHSRALYRHGKIRGAFEIGLGSLGRARRTKRVSQRAICATIR